ncbi:hypothetical protein, partial [Nocardia abscessus]|uniref:hypothetical protein n=1 Tax=Nocardia abscessus TaxID=120957 RepID=UPI003CC7FEB4
MASQHSELRSPAELIVVTHGADTAITPIALRESRSVQAHLGELLPAGGELVRVFGPANRLERRLAGTAHEDAGAEYLNYFSVQGVTGELDELAARLRAPPPGGGGVFSPPPPPPQTPGPARG